MQVIVAVGGLVVGIIVFLVVWWNVADDNKCASAERYGNPGSTNGEKFLNLCWVPGRGAETGATPRPGSTEVPK